jgi:CheY-like chemotaxis protein
MIGLRPGQPECRLLVVDDNVESRLLLRRLLEPLGFHVLEAAGGQDAIEIHTRHQPHLIWMDIRMPGMDGYEAGQKIREAEREEHEDGGQNHTPIIALTAGMMESKESSPLSWVFDDWVYKPFREREIYEKIEKHLGMEFVYQPPASSPVHDLASRDEKAFTPADLAVLPGEWLGGFFSEPEEGALPGASRADRSDSPGTRRPVPHPGRIRTDSPV